jgi:hypothetical protein
MLPGSIVREAIERTTIDRAMRVTTCPTATIHAPIDIVWRLLTDPDEYVHWGGHVVAVDPPGTLRPGQRIVLHERTFGRWFAVRFDVRAVRDLPNRSIRVDVHLPFGVVNRELISCAALGPESTFVSFN